MGSLHGQNESTIAMDVRGLEIGGNQAQRGMIVLVGSLKLTFRIRGHMPANLNGDRIGLLVRLAIWKGGGLRVRVHHRPPALPRRLVHR